MIPAFDDNGYLPAGIHPANIDEVVRRFGEGSELRHAQAQSLQWLLPLCRRAGIRRLIVNGSFVTDIPEPNDVDCLLLIGDDYNDAAEVAIELEQGLPFLSLQIVKQAAFDYLASGFFGTDRHGTTKGVIEVIL